MRDDAQKSPTEREPCIANITVRTIVRMLSGLFFVGLAVCAHQGSMVVPGTCRLLMAQPTLDLFADHFVYQKIVLMMMQRYVK